MNLDSADTMPRPRQAVEAMESYRPPLEGRRSKTRLDFNENTVGLGAVFPDIEPNHLTAYPEYQTLIEALAAYLNIPEDHLLITNGSDEGLFVAPFTFLEPNKGKALISAPTFSLFAHYLKLCQARFTEVVVQDDLSFDLKVLTASLDVGAQFAMFASPDNPTGDVIPMDTLELWLKSYPQTMFLMDEAYYEYYEVTALDLLPRFPNLIVSRTFSKAWGLAGLRLGFLAAHPQVIEWMRRVRSPYSVNALAVDSLLKLLPKSDTVFEQARLAMARKQRVLTELTELGYRLTPGQANFFLIWLGDRAKELVSFLGANDILVRDRSNLAKMKGSVRVSVGSEEEMQKFLRLMRTFTKENPQ